MQDVIAAEEYPKENSFKNNQGISD